MSAPQRNARLWLLLSAAVIAIDFAVKQWALTALTPHVAVPVIDGLLNWTLTFNPGAAFSLLSEASGWQRWFFSVLAVAVSAVLAWWLSRIERGDWRQALPFALIIGGALGNLIDRLRYGHVVDYIDVYWRDWHWPAFNVADAAIVGGAIAMVLFSFHKPATPPKP